MEVNIRRKLKFGNILYGCLRQVGCLIEVTTNTGLKVQCVAPIFVNILYGCLRQVGCLIEVTANTGLTVQSIAPIFVLVDSWAHDKLPVNPATHAPLNHFLSLL